MKLTWATPFGWDESMPLDTLRKSFSIDSNQYIVEVHFLEDSLPKIGIKDEKNDVLYWFIDSNPNIVGYEKINIYTSEQLVPEGNKVSVVYTLSDDDGDSFHESIMRITNREDQEFNREIYSSTLDNGIYDEATYLSRINEKRYLKGSVEFLRENVVYLIENGDINEDGRGTIVPTNEDINEKSEGTIDLTNVDIHIIRNDVKNPFFSLTGGGMYGLKYNLDNAIVPNNEKITSNNENPNRKEINFK
jgi:hypothetical protein